MPASTIECAWVGRTRPPSRRLLMRSTASRQSRSSVSCERGLGSGSGGEVNGPPRLRREIGRLVHLHNETSLRPRHERRRAEGHTLEKVKGLGFHGAGVYVVDTFTRHGGNRELN